MSVKVHRVPGIALRDQYLYTESLPLPERLVLVYKVLSVPVEVNTSILSPSNCHLRSVLVSRVASISTSGQLKYLESLSISTGNKQKHSESQSVPLEVSKVSKVQVIITRGQNEYQGALSLSIEVSTINQSPLHCH